MGKGIKQNCYIFPVPNICLYALKYRFVGIKQYRKVKMKNEMFSCSIMNATKNMLIYCYLFLFYVLQNHVNPAMDFTQTPPGMLALDNMLYFAKQQQDAYIRVRPLSLSFGLSVPFKKPLF